MLYFHAASPQSDDRISHLRTISEFANAKLVRFPDTGEYNSYLDERIVAAAQEAARLSSIYITHLAQ